MKAFIVAAGLLGLTATAAHAQGAAPVAPWAAAKPERPKVDANGDGRVTLAEFQARAAARFARMDANNDGRVAKDELPARGHRGHHGQGPAAAPGQAAAPPAGAPQAGDHRGHGQMGRHHGRRGGMRGMAFGRMDLNDDGVVSRDEADRSARRLFTFLDLNEDGVLAGKEMPMRGMGGRGTGGRGPK